MFSFPKKRANGSNLSVGKPETKPDAPAHTRGVKQGNLAGRKKKEKGLVAADGAGAKATARRSTSINPEARDPIDPLMPNLPPA